MVIPLNMVIIGFEPSPYLPLLEIHHLWGSPKRWTLLQLPSAPQGLRGGCWKAWRWCPTREPTREKFISLSDICGGLHKWWYPKIDVSNGKSQSKMDDLGVAPILGHRHMFFIVVPAGFGAQRWPNGFERHRTCCASSSSRSFSQFCLLKEHCDTNHSTCALNVRISQCSSNSEVFLEK